MREFAPSLFTPSNKPSHGEWRTLDGRNLTEIKPGEINDCREFIENHNGVDGFELYGNTQWEYQFIANEYPGEIHANHGMVRVCVIDIEVACDAGFSTVKDASEQVLVISCKVNGEPTHTFCVGDVPDTGGSVLHCHPNEKKMLHDFCLWWKEADVDVVSGWNVKFYDIPYIVNRLRNLFGDDAPKALSPWGIVKDRTEEFMNRKNDIYEIVGVAIMDFLQLYMKFTYAKRESYKLDYIAHVELDARKVNWQDKYASMKEFYESDFPGFVGYNIVDVELVCQLESKLKLIDLCLAMAYNAKVNIPDVLSQTRTWDQIIYHHLHDRKVAIPQKKTYAKSDQYEGAYVKEPVPGVYDWIVSFDLNSLYPHLIMQYGISPDSAVPRSDIAAAASQPNQPPSVVEKHRRLLAMVDSLTVENIIAKEVDTPLLREFDLSMAANGTLYKRSPQGFLPFLMEKMYKDRKAAKKKGLACQQQAERIKKTIDDGLKGATGDLAGKSEEQLRTMLKESQEEAVRMETRQMALKVQLNSAYGALGSSYFRYYSLDMAVAITKSGQLSIRWLIESLNRRMNEILKTDGVDYVIASDTDSVYINMSPLVSKVFPPGASKKAIVDFLDKAAGKMRETIDKSCAELAELLNARENKMVMEREVIADRGFWTAKKRYALNVWDSEGVRYEKPKLKIKGIETQRSSTPEMSRNALKAGINIILNADEAKLQEHVAAFKASFMASPPEAVAKPIGCNGLTKYVNEGGLDRKGVPGHVRGAIVYNELIRDRGLSNRYPMVMDGEKVKFVYLKTPNPTGHDAISFPGKLPKELDLARFVDYNAQYETMFLSPLLAITMLLGWNAERKNTLDTLFA